jgi:hypothetical protein
MKEGPLFVVLRQMSGGFRKWEIVINTLSEPPR